MHETARVLALFALLATANSALAQPSFRIELDTATGLENGPRVLTPDTGTLRLDNRGVAIGLTYTNHDRSRLSLAFGVWGERRLPAGDYTESVHDHRLGDLAVDYVWPLGRCGLARQDYSISDARYNGRDLVRTLALDFEQTCSTGGPTVIGRVRVDLTVDAGRNLTVVPGTEIAIDGRAWSRLGGDMDFSWTQTEGQPVELDVSGSSLRFDAPAPIDTYEILTFRLEAIDDPAVAADTVEVVVSPLAPSNSLRQTDSAGRVVDGPLVASQIEVQGVSPSRISVHYSPRIDDPVPDRLPFRLDFTTPYGDPITRGWYAGARDHYTGATPGLSVSGVDCFTASGHFLVKDVAYSPTGELERFAVDYAAGCGTGLSESKSGALRFNSVVPTTLSGPTAGAGPDVTALVGERVPLDAGHSLSGVAPIESYQWRQVSGAPDLALDNANTPRASFTAPELPDIGSTFVFEVEVADGAGRSSRDRVAVTVPGANEPKSYIKLFDDPDGHDFVIANKDRYLTVNTGVFTTIYHDNDGRRIHQIWYDDGNLAMALGSIAGETLTPGVYGGTGDWPPDVVAPHFSLGFDGRGCNKQPATLVVHEVRFDEWGMIEGLAADFEFLCDPGLVPDKVPGLTRGLIRYRSAVPENVTTPIAAAGLDQTATPNETVELDGRHSFSGAGTIVDYRWEQVGGPAVVLEDADAAVASFVWDAVGSEPVTLVFRLTVEDADGEQATDDVAVTAYPSGAPFTGFMLVPEYEPPYSLDPDNSRIRTYGDEEGIGLELNWPSAKYFSFELYPRRGHTLVPGVIPLGAFERLGDIYPVIKATGAGSPICGERWGQVFLHEYAHDADGRILRLAADVDYGCGVEGNGATYFLRVNSARPFISREPQASAGIDWVISSGEEVLLDGSGSRDRDGAIVDYSWRQIAGPAVELLGHGTPELLVRTPPGGAEDVEVRLELTVTDNEGLTGNDTATVTVKGTNSPRRLFYIRAPARSGWPYPFEYLYDENSGHMWTKVNVNPNNFGAGIKAPTDVRFYFEPRSGEELEIGRRYTFFGHRTTVDEASLSLVAEATVFDNATGWFEIHEFEQVEDEIVSLALDFEVKNRSDAAPVVGSYRFDSALPLRFQPLAAAPSAQYEEGREGFTFRLDAGESWTTGSSIAGYRWRVVEGDGVSLERDRGPETAFAIPDPDLAPHVVVELEIEDSEGRTDASLFYVHALGSGIDAFPVGRIARESSNRTPVAISTASGAVVGVQGISRTRISSSAADAPLSRPVGIVDVTLREDGGRPRLTLMFEEALPPGVAWGSYDPDRRVWRRGEAPASMSADRRQVSFDFSDGSTHDLMPDDAGLIRVVGGPVLYESTKPPASVPGSGQSGGGGSSGGGGATGLLELLMAAGAFVCRRRFRPDGRTRCRTIVRPSARAVGQEKSPRSAGFF